MNHVQAFIQKVTQWRVIVPLGLVLVTSLVLPQQSSLPRMSSRNVPAADTKSLIANFNVRKKMTCTIASASATIDDMRVRVRYPGATTIEHVLFDGDCLYRWKEKANSGERSCGLRSYLPLVKSIATNQSVERIFPQAQELAASCKSVTTIDEKTFRPPTNILFKNKKLL